MRVVRIIFIAGIIFMAACSGAKKKSAQMEQVNTIIDGVKSEFAPDGRVAVFDLEVGWESDGFIIKGETNLPEAKNALHQKLNQAGITYTSIIKDLPEKSLQGKHSGVINVSVANMRSNPSHPAQLVTQATLGTPVDVFKKSDNWYYIQTPDDYLGWVDSGAIVLMDDRDFKNWQNSAKLIILETFALTYKTTAANEIESDLVATNILQNHGVEGNYYQVRFPDGRNGFIEKKIAIPLDEWKKRPEPSGQDIVSTARKFTGFPYLWGGTSPKAMDCSGFTKTVYFLNGMIIPRDASQQVNTGELVDNSENFQNLRAGDLLFFGEKATDTTEARIVHVGIWTGQNQEMIHAAASGKFQGRVVLSSFDENADNYDPHNLNRYVKTKRILENPEGNIVQLKKADLF